MRPRQIAGEHAGGQPEGGAIGKTDRITLLATPALSQSQGMSHLGIPMDRIGLVGFTIREQMFEDVRETIAAVTSCGIRNIEFSMADLKGGVPSFQGSPVAELATLSEEFGFDVPSLGVSAADLDQRIDKVIAAAQALGASYVRISGNFPQDGVTFPREEYLELARILNASSGPLSEAGITVAYHNHGWEFEMLSEGHSGMDVLLEQTDPEKVAFELDLFWSETAGVDTVALIENNPGRFPLFHVKDAKLGLNAAGDETPTFATVGSGYIDFANIFEHAGTAGAEYFYIENDQPEPDGITVACGSYAYLATN